MGTVFFKFFSGWTVVGEPSEQPSCRHSNQLMRKEIFDVVDGSQCAM
jgi:hypothetical protein